MCLDVFFQILWALESLAAEVALVGLEWNVDANVGGDVIALDGGCSASTPLASQVEVVGALTSDMAFADVVLLKPDVSRVFVGWKRRLSPTYIERFGAVASLATSLPLTGQVVDGG